MSEAVIVLDPKIRDWVLIPIFVVMFMQGVLRQYISVLLRDDKRPSKEILTELESSQQIARSRRLRQNGAYLSPAAFRMRKAYFMQDAFKGKQGDESSEMPNPMGGDPVQMMSGMKQQMMMIVPSILLMGWASYFFSGFVAAKTPFPLPERFRSMLQRGIGLQSLEVSYVSSLSWTFMLMFGMRGLFTLVLGDDSDVGDSTKMMQAQMAAPMAMGMMGGGPPDWGKQMQAERTELEILQHDCLVPTAEARMFEAARTGASKQ